MDFMTEEGVCFILPTLTINKSPTVVEKYMANRPYILGYKDPLLTYLLVSVPSILTLR